MEEPKKEKQDPHAAQVKQKEDEKKDPSIIPPQKIRKERSEVITVRNWREYLGESLLIVFSVILALFLTERFTKLHEEHQTHQVLRQLRDELISNKKGEEEQYAYHSQILKKIDSALNNSVFAQKFIIDGKVNFAVITPPPHVVLLHDLNNVAWQVAKQNNIFSKLDLSTYSLLTDIYNNQDRITKSEEEIANVLLSWESRKPENLRTALILVRDNYHAWAMDRVPSLLRKYTEAIDKLKNY